MSNCGKCRGSGLWQGRVGYKCFACSGSGERVGRLERAARIESVASGRMLLVDAMPTLAEVKAGRASVAAAAVSVRLVSRMGPGAARLRAAALGRADLDERCSTGQFCPTHDLVDVPSSSAERAARAAQAASAPAQPGKPLRPLTPGKPRLFAEVFPDDATDADRAELAAQAFMRATGTADRPARPSDGVFAGNSDGA